MSDTKMNFKYLILLFCMCLVGCRRAEVLSEFQDSVCIAKSARVDVGGYEHYDGALNLDPGAYTIDLSEHGERLAKAAQVEFLPRFAPDTEVSSDLAIRVQLRLPHGRTYRFELIGEETLRIGPKLDYVAQIADDDETFRLMLIKLCRRSTKSE